MSDASDRQAFVRRNSCETDAGQQNWWRLEAEAVIQDIGSHVNCVTISHKLPCNESHIFLNLETKESVRVTIEMSASGFRISGLEYDCNEDPISSSSHFFETIYALLDNLSTGYRSSFSSDLANRLNQLSET